MKWQQKPDATTWVLCLGSLAVASVTWSSANKDKRWRVTMLLPGVLVKEGKEFHAEELSARSQAERLTKGWLDKAGLVPSSTYLHRPLRAKGDMIENSFGVAIAKTIDDQTAEALVGAANIGVWE